MKKRYTAFGHKINGLNSEGFYFRDGLKAEFPYIYIHAVSHCS